jgi:uncharacterized protein
MEFEWDDAKADSNELKHGVSFTEAMTVFSDPLSLTGHDPEHSIDEDRYLTMGMSAEGRLLIVSHTDRGEIIRIAVLAKQAVASERTTKMAVSPDNAESAGDELRPEYDFRKLQGVVRGKYAARYRERLRLVRLAEDVAEAFQDEAAVNEALREYLRGRPSAQSPA